MTNKASKIRSSYHQERMWFIDKFETANIYSAQPTYHNIPLILCIKGALDRAAMERSINIVAGRHEALRTTIRTENENPVQWISKEVHVRLYVEDRPHQEFDSGNQAHVNGIAKNCLEPIPLSGERLLSARLFTFSNDTSVLLLTFHHAVVDRRSVDIVASEILAAYEALQRGVEPAADDPGLQYADFSEWQRGLTPADWEPFLFYWKRQLAGPLEILDLPADSPRAPIHVYSQGQVAFPLRAHLLEKVARFGKDFGLQTQDVFMGAWILLLHQYSSLSEINIGLMMPNRRHADVRNVVGPVANLVTIRSLVDAARSKEEFFTDLKQLLREAEAYQDLPFETLVLELVPVPDMSRTALFDVLFTFEQSIALPGITGAAVEKVENNLGLGKYDLNLLIKEKGGAGAGYLVYNAHLYREATARRLGCHYANLLESLVGDSSGPLYELEILDPEEKSLLRDRWNDTGATYPQAETLASLFERAVNVWPERIALEQGGVAVSYGELNAKSNRLAHYLKQSRKIKRRDYVGIGLEKSTQMIVVVLAALKAGAAYVPIDPALPSRRKNFIIEDTGCSLLFVDGEIEAEAAPSVVDINLIDLLGYSDANLGEGPSPDDPAYVIYTSGSTGAPKGCRVSHRNVVRLIKNDRHDFDFNEQDVWIMVHSLSFDFSVWEIWGAILYGAKLVLPRKAQTQDVSELYNLIAGSRVTVLNQTPDSFYVLSAMALQDTSHDIASHLRMVVFGGAKLDPTRFKAWMRRYPLDRVQLINMYGITETTVHVTYYEITERDVLSDHPISIIGRPLPETRVYIGDAHARPCPIGVWGEIHIGGTGVASGYLNRPELTAEKFVERPSLGKGRLYASGDIGRWLDNGTIEYLGRRDTQVKIRGFRIESAEVAFYLNQHPDIRDAVVVSRINPDSHTGELVAYYTEPEGGSKGTGLTPASLREHLVGYLPGYMIPTLFLPVHRIPLNSSGKVDLRILTASNADAAQTVAQEHVLPHNRAERVIAEVWELCLSRKNIGVHDNYFDLGGHSLTAAKIVAEINAELPGEMKLSDIFLYPTVSQLAVYLTGRPVVVMVGPSPIPERSSYPASLAQQRIWTHEQFDELKNIYNVPAAFRLSGDVDVEAMSGAIDELVARHESLRTSFTRHAGTLRQVVSPPRHFEIQRHDYSGDERREEFAKHFVRSEAVSPFDLSQVPLFRASLLKMGQGEYLLVVTIHHIISDGWSLYVLQRELSALYAARRSRTPHTLLPLPYHYKDFAAWQRSMLDSESMADLRHYWQAKLLRQLAPDALRRVSSTASGMQAFSGDTLIFRMNPDQADAIRSLARAEESSLFMALLTCVKVLLFKYTAESDVIVGSPVAGRQLAGLEGQIGCYINMLPLRDVISEAASFREILGQVRKTFLDALDHQAYPIEYMFEGGGPPGELGANPFFTVVVILQNQEQVRFELEGVEVTPLPVRKETSLFDLVFEFKEAGQSLELCLSYRHALYDAERIERLWAHFETLVAQCLDQPARPVGRLSILPPGETELLASTALSPIEARVSTGVNIVEAFESVSAKHADRAAVTMNGKTISYAELDQRADSIAQELISGFLIQTDDVVALLFEPSIEAVTAILGVVKAGAAYLPLDPSWPEKRIEHILKDSRCKLVLCGMGLDATARRISSLPVIAVGSERPLVGRPVIERSIRPDQLAYVIYTSGSTGLPKGVMIEHRAILNLIGGLAALIYDNYPSGMNVGCVASFVFDASVQQIFASLLLGHTLYPIPNEVKKSPADLIAFVRDNSIGVLDMTPSLFQMLLRFHPEGDLAPGLKHLIIGGEALPPSSVGTFFANERNQGVVISNVYGPTEATVDVTCYECLPGSDHRSVPIGRPLPNLRIYVLDKNLRMAPFGDCGEICIGGAGLARGYVNHGGSSSMKFVEAPHLGEERIYRTGDMGRWSREGNLQFIGRIDRQIKLRGHRIELEEIEAKILSCAGVEAAVVTLVGESENQNICAYYVAGEETSDALLRAYLSEHLPAYMIPPFVVRISSVPLNSSGKVDLSALPKPAFAGHGGDERVDGTTLVALVSIWSKVLKIDPGCIDARKTFFELGGNSLNSVYALAEIYEQLGVSIRLADFYRHPDVLSLSAFIEMQRSALASRLAIAPVSDGVILPLTFQQKRIWVQCEKDPSGSSYHMPGSMRFDRSPDADAVRTALRELVAGHQALRLRFVRSEGEVRQRIAADPAFSFESIDISREANIEEALQRVVSEALLQPFDLENGPLFRFISVELSPQRHELLYNFHHLIADGWSVETLKKEFEESYHGIVSKTPLAPRPPRHGYLDYVHHHLEQLNDRENIDNTTQFWSRRIRQGLPRAQNDWRAGGPSPSGQGYGCGIDGALKDAIRRQAKALDTTVPVILFTTFLRVLRRFYASEQVAAYLIHSGRDRVEFKDTVGVFVNPLVVVSRLDTTHTMAQLVRGVHREVHELLQYQSFPMELVLDQLGMPTFAPPFAFNMLDLPDFVHRSELGERGAYRRYNLPAAKFQLELYVADHKDGMETFWSFDGRHFDMSMVEYLGGEYARLLRQFVSDAASPNASGGRKTLTLPGRS